MRLHPLVGLRLITRLRHREDGQALVEWAVIIGAGAALLIVAMLFLGGKVDHLYRNIDSGPPATLTPPVAQCDSNYAGGCIPPRPPDLACGDLSALGIPLPVRVTGGDPHGFDPDGDGFGC